MSFFLRVPGLGQDFPLSPILFDTLSSLGISNSCAQRGYHEILSKLIIFLKVELFFSCICNLLRALLFEQAHIYFAVINGSDKGSWCGFGLRDGGGGIKLDQYSVNVGSLHPYVSHIFETLCKRSFWNPVITLDFQLTSKSNSGPRRFAKVVNVRPPTKRTSLFPIKYFTVHIFPPSSMDIISDKIRYPVLKFFTKDKSLTFS